jgi:anti-sigma-K factor RskA
MDTQAPEFEQRLSDLEAHIERLTHTLQHWRDSQEHLQPIERRLTQLTDHCADILKQWTATGERHAHAVNELETRLTGWNEIETRLQRDASFRFQALERTIEQEWSALRSLHEEPTRQLRAQAESLTEICVTTAGSAQTGLERAEARLALLESDLHRRMDELTHDVQAAVAELRQRVDPAALHGPAKPWQLDEVTRLHQELRDGAAQAPTASTDPPPPRETATGLAVRRPVTIFDSTDEPRSDRGRQADARAAAAPIASPSASNAKWYAAIAVFVLALAVAGFVAYSFYRMATNAAALASEAQQHAERIATAATRSIEAARQDAAQQIAEARETASKAQVVSDVLAAPDLLRFNLAGGEAESRSSGQLLWSRSRGVVFSGSRLPVPPDGSTYQLWLLTTAAPVSGGTFVPDASGRATQATATPPAIPRAVVGARVTLERTPGNSAPSGTTVLARTQ